MRWVAHANYHDEHTQRHVNGRWSYLAIENGRGEGEIDILDWVGEARRNQEENHDCRLKGKRAAVVAGSADRPDEQNEQDRVEKRHQTQPEWIARLEQILGAADQVAAEEEPPGRVEYPQEVDEQRRDRLTGYEQSVVRHNADTGENDCDVTEMQKIRRAPESPVGRNVEDEPGKRGPAQPRREFSMGCGG